MYRLLPLCFMALPLVGYVCDLPWLAMAVSALVLPLLEWLWRQSRVPRAWSWGEALPRACLVFIVAQTLLVAVLAEHMSWAMVVVMGLSVGYVSGGSGIVLAHELGHRRSAVDRVLSRVLLLSVGFGHYAIEHNRGHHRAAATYPDPATARQEESLWTFLPRYYRGVWREAVQLSRQSSSPLNEAWALMCATVVLVLAIYLIAGRHGLVFMAVQALQAQLLVGAVDYMEHWGLRRADHHGKPERMGPAHTWDCANVVSDLMLFNLPRHASHHLEPSLKADDLYHVPQAPQMPTGYAGMVVLTMLPPLFRRVMTPRLPTSRL